MSEFFGPDLSNLEYTIKEFLRENEQGYFNSLRYNKSIKEIVKQIVSDFNKRYDIRLSESVFISYVGRTYVVKNITDVLFCYEMFDDIEKRDWDIKIC